MSDIIPPILLYPRWSNLRDPNEPVWSTELNQSDWDHLSGLRTSNRDESSVPRRVTCTYTETPFSKLQTAMPAAALSKKPSSRWGPAGTSHDVSTNSKRFVEEKPDGNLAPSQGQSSGLGNGAEKGLPPVHERQIQAQRVPAS